MLLSVDLPRRLDDIFSTPLLLSSLITVVFFVELTTTGLVRLRDLDACAVVALLEAGVLDRRGFFAAIDFADLLGTTFLSVDLLVSVLFAVVGF